jgi:hypothetical protein
MLRKFSGALRPLSSRANRNRLKALAKAKAQAAASISAAAKSGSEDKHVPNFKALLHKFYKAGHPDLLRSISPQKAEQNTASFQILNGILTSIKEADGHPAQTVKNITFHLISSNGTDIEKATLSVRTGGGDSRRTLTKSFSSFYKDAGFGDGNFTWDDEYFREETN